MTAAYVGFFTVQEKEVVAAAVEAAQIHESIIQIATTACTDIMLEEGMLEIWINDLNEAERFRQAYQAQKQKT